MIKKFSDLNIGKEVLKGIESMSFKSPSSVQREVIPKMLEKKDIIVKSKTGSGKTASFGVPICESIDINKNCIQALVIVPTRELALQVKDEISNIGRFKKVRCEAIYGKQPIKEQISSLKQRIHVVVATPGRIIDHINRETIDVSNINYIVIDEADKMLNKGFIEQIEDIMKNTSSNKVIGLFSATIDEDILKISNNYMNNTEIIEIKSKDTVANNQIKEFKMYTNEENKYEALKNIIYKENPKSLIVFLNTRDRVDKIYRQLRKDKFYVREIHGDMSQEKRQYTLKDFKEEKFNVLVSSDVTARGIHIEDIALIINFDVPKDKEVYVHRIGRTGRKDKFGKAITLVSNKEEKFMNEIETYTENVKEELLSLDIKELTKEKEKYHSRKPLAKKNTSNVDNKSKSDITRLYLNAGKKKKIRVIDIVGAINNLKGIDSEDIGVIKVEDLCSYVDILNNKGNSIVKNYKEINIKKKLVKIKRDNSK